ncbi:MAG: RNA methyltransferase [Anaerolineales bacterium]
MITSNQNPKIRLARALFGRPKERREAGAFVVEGVRLVEEAAEANWPMRFVLFDELLSDRGKVLVEKLISQGVDVEEVSRSVMHSLSETETPQGVLAVLNDFRLPIPDALNFILLPDQIRDPGNLGTLLRSAAATGVQAVLIPPETTDAFAPKVLRSGMGAHFKLPIQSLSWDEIQKRIVGMQTYIADMDGLPCWSTDLRNPVVLIVGNEAEGASESARKISTGKLSIPMIGDVESLNAGVAGSVLMFEVVRQRSTL